jgi:hypothetical protein
MNFPVKAPSIQSKNRLLWKRRPKIHDSVGNYAECDVYVSIQPVSTRDARIKIKSVSQATPEFVSP